MSKQSSSAKGARQSALSKSMQSDDSSSVDSTHVSSRPSVMDMANAFQKMSNNIKKRANSSSPKKRTIKSPNKLVTSANRHHSHATATHNNEKEDKSDELVSQFKEFDTRKSQNKIKKLESSLKRKSEEIEELQCLVEEQQKTFKQKIKSLKHKEEKIRRLSDQMSDKTKENEKLNNEITDLRRQNNELIAFKEDSNGRIQILNAEISALNKEIKENANENRKLSKDKMKLSQQKRMEDHVINIANYEELKQYAEKLENELRKVKNTQMSETLKKEKRFLKLERLKDELLRTKQSLLIKNNEFEDLKQSFARITLYKTHNPNDTVFNKQSLGKIKDQITLQKKELKKTKKNVTREMNKMKQLMTKSLEKLKNYKWQGSTDSAWSVPSIPSQSASSQKTPKARTMQPLHEEKSLILPTRRKSEIEQAVGSLDNLFLSDHRNVSSSNGQLVIPKSTPLIPVYPSRPSNLSQQLLSRSRSGSSTRSTGTQSDSPQKTLTAYISDPYKLKMDEMAVEIQHKEDEIKHKEEMLERLSEENKIFREQIVDLRHQLNYEEKLNEMCQSNHNIENLLSTFQTERNIHNHQMVSMGHQLHAIVKQNRELRRSLNNITRELSNSPMPHSESQSVDVIRENIQSRTVHAIPPNLSMSDMSDRSFSEIFLEQISMEPPKEVPEEKE